MLRFKLSLGHKLFLYTSGLLVGLLLATFLLLERVEARQWDAYLYDNSLSFARLATPELLKRFRGDFSGAASVNVDILAANRDLLGFVFASPTGRVLYRSPQLQGNEILLNDDPFHAANVIVGEGGSRAVTLTLPDNSRVLWIEVPALGPTRETILTARYVFSYQAIDRRLAEVRLHFVRILLVSLIASFFLAASLARRLIRPLRDLNRGVEAISRGDLEARIATQSTDEIGELARAFNQMAASLLSGRDELTEKNRVLEAINRELQQMQENLLRSERLAAIGQLAAGVSHEIDNPVGIILGLAELMLEETPADDSRHADLTAIVEECKRCRRITGGLLGFARSSPGEFGPVDLAALVSATLESLRPQKLFKTLDIRYSTESAPLVFADADKLRQVLVNLCINAAQAMRGGGRLDISVRPDNGRVLISIADNGPGITPDAREKIFEPFFSTKGRGEGTGLGLSICRRLVEDHGGTLTVESPEGGGATFIIALPVGGEKNFDNGGSVSIR